MIKPVILYILLLCIPYGIYAQNDGQDKTSVFKIVKPKAQDSVRTGVQSAWLVLQPMVPAPLKVVKVQAEIHNVTTNHYIYFNTLIETGIIDVTDSIKWKVINFDLDISAYDVLTADSNNIDPKLSGSFHSDNGQFSKATIKAIKKAKQGKFKFTHIMALTSSGQKINLDELVVYVYATPNAK